MGSLTDEYCTPKWLADRVGEFNLDPCSNTRSHIRTTVTYSLARGENGLDMEWYGRVWLNPPYSNPLPWVTKLRLEMREGRCTEAMALVKLDCSTKWWKVLTEYIPGDIDMWLFHNRIQFEPPEGVKVSSNNFCSVLMGLGMTPRLDLSDVADLWVPG